MVNAAEVSGVFRISRLRFQAGDEGAILVGERLEQDGRAQDRKTLCISGRQLKDRRPFHVGQSIQIVGRERTWRDRRTGQDEIQIAVREWFEVRPRGANWIDYVAGNPAFKGIGKTIAQRIWDRAGATIFTLLAGRDVSAIVASAPECSREAAAAMVNAWAECGQDQLVQWLDGRMLPRGLSINILNAYENQDEAVERFNADPYRLLAFGISWKRIDEIASRSFGVAVNDPRRLHAAVVESLMAEYHRGHTAVKSAQLTLRIVRLLKIKEKEAAEALRLVFSNGGFVRIAEDLFQLRGVQVMESAIAADVTRRCAGASQFQLDLGYDQAITEYEKHNAAGISLTDRQRSAVRSAIMLPFSVVVGGAGTGKTALLAALHHSIETVTGQKGGVLQMALAGRAAKRMRDATGRDAITIAGFLHTIQDDRIEATSHLIIDEASMLDVPSFYAILRRLRGRANIVLVGDDFQLPPVGSGKILHLLTGRRDLPITMLDRVWRQEDGNSIRTVATSVRSGLIPELPVFSGLQDGVSIFHAAHSIPEAVRNLFQRLGGADDASDVRVIAPRRSAGSTSAHSINLEIHSALFSDGEPVVGAMGDTGFSIGDRFVCNKNHWDIDLMNGSLGRILRHASIEGAKAARIQDDERSRDSWSPLACVEIDGVERLIGEHHLSDCSWGYALTCHRAQGSDFSRVIVVLDDTVDQSWLYTAITRGCRQVVLVGTQAQVELILSRQPRVNERCVGLETLLSRRMNQMQVHGAAQ